LSNETLIPPKPKGPYASTYRVGDVLYLSGQGSIEPGTGNVVAGDVQVQTTQTLTNIEALLRSEGFDVGDLAQLTCYLVDIDEWSAMNEAYAAYLGERAHPVRTAVEVAALPFGLRIEITAVAHKKDA
jgi:2-iminobutanoate/2-iminopropanoate deaminase